MMQPPTPNNVTAAPCCLNHVNAPVPNNMMDAPVPHQSQLRWPFSFNNVSGGSCKGMGEGCVLKVAPRSGWEALISISNSFVLNININMFIIYNLLWLLHGVTLLSHNFSLTFYWLFIFTELHILMQLYKTWILLLTQTVYVIYEPICLRQMTPISSGCESATTNPSRAWIPFRIWANGPAKTPNKDRTYRQVPCKRKQGLIATNELWWTVNNAYSSYQ